MRNMIGRGECRDARPVHPLTQPCTFVFHSPWADARTVRPHNGGLAMLRKKGTVLRLKHGAPWGVISCFFSVFDIDDTVLFVSR